MREIYLDNSATTRPLPEVVEAMVQTLTDNYGNPSSLHNKGLKAEKILKAARRKIAEKLAVSPEEIIFTSGGTESNNLAIKGIAYQYQNRGRHLVTTEVEHPSVLESFLALEEEGFEVTFLEADRYGRISLDDLRDSITPETILASIIHVNNELGTIHPLAEIGTIIKEKNPNTFFHTDCIQSFGKMLVQPARSMVDLLSISGHKIHGPKGIGVLYKRKGIELRALQTGGGQENGYRCGTENIPGIAGLIPALDALPDYTEENPYNQELDRLKNHFIRGLEKIDRKVIINSPEDGAPHILNISFPGIKGEVLIHSLEAEGVYVSTGSACHSKSREKSHVLRAIGLPMEQIDGTIRVSFSTYNTIEELDYALASLAKQLKTFF
ncbi:MAG: cysteine desulfurase [Halanaerobiaceae bacterium]|nr:cysteine desulfurase [Halanaerobiaceae bacterium]